MFSLKNEKKCIKQILLIAEIIFTAAALISVFKYGNSLLLGSLRKFNNDDVKYIRSAWNLLDNKIISYENIKEPTVYIMPGLTYVLSFFMLIFGKFGGITAFKVFQVFLQSAGIYLIFLIGRKVFNSKIGIIACITDALYAVEIYAANTVLMECIFKFLLLLLIYISIYAVENKSMKLYICGGIIWGISCFFKPTAAVYPIVILIMWVRNKYKFSDIFKYTIVVLGIFCLIMAPWWIRNYKTFNKFIPFTKSSGNPFLQGTFINYDQSKGWGVPYIIGKNSIENNQNEINAGFKRLKIYAKKEPFKYILWYTAGKTFYFWLSPFYWRSIFHIPAAYMYALHFTILFLGIIGIINEIKKSSNSVFLFSILTLFNVVYLPFYTFSRYSYPLMPLVIIFAATAINKIMTSKKLFEKERINAKNIN